MAKHTLEDIFKKLEELSEGQAAITDPPMDVKQAADYLRLRVATVYKLTSRGEIPYYKRRKKLLFLRSELHAWVKGRKSRSNEEIGKIAGENKGGGRCEERGGRKNEQGE